MIVARMRRAGERVDDVVERAALDARGHPLIIRLDPARRRRILLAALKRAEDLTQIMRRRAGPHDQNALLAQGAKRRAEPRVPCAVAMGRNRELNDGNARVGKEELQRNPCAMIEAAPRDETRALPLSGDQFGGAAGERGIAAGGIGDRIKFRLEAAEVIDHAGPVVGGERRRVRLEMRAHHHNGARAAALRDQPFAVGGEKGAGGRVFENEVRRAVRHEQGGKRHGFLRNVWRTDKASRRDAPLRGCKRGFAGATTRRRWSGENAPAQRDSHAASQTSAAASDAISTAAEPTSFTNLMWGCRSGVT